MAERIFGYASGDAMGKSLDIIIPERLRARHWQGYRRVMVTGESRYGHGDVLAVPGIRMDGTGVSLKFTIVPVRDETSRMIGMVAIMRDVTARFEEMRALRQKIASCRTRDKAMAAQSQPFVNSPWNALLSSERALKTLNSWNSMSVVKAIV